MNPERRRGTVFGFTGYLLWGVFPLYFRLLDTSGAVEILLHRVIWTMLTCCLLVLALRQRATLATILRQRALLWRLALASSVLALNWLTFIYAVNSGRVVESSLGYFINPLVTVTLGVLVLHERLRRWQWAAIGTGLVAVLVLSVDYGRPPWIALVLAFSFATYGLLKNRVGAAVGALPGMTVEALALAPAALAGLAWLEASGGGTFSANAPWQALLLVSTGPATLVPLLLFAAGARRVPLSTMGLLQYLTPVLQLLCGLVLLGESMPLGRWIGFGLVWVALAILSVDALRAAARSRGGGPKRGANWRSAGGRERPIRATRRGGAALGGAVDDGLGERPQCVPGRAVR
jgi:chloramphenicol-sensitive protein RarD